MTGTDTAPPAPGRPLGPWRILVPVTALLAGLLAATSAATAHGTDLRAGRFSQLTDLVEQQRLAVAAQERVAAQLRATVASQAARGAAGSSRVTAARAAGAAVAAAAGATPVSGGGLTVVLDDAPRTALPASSNPDDLVVHQQDVQSVVNALWAGGADGMTLMGERVVSTTAVRCVGNTLLIQGRLVGPPFRISAVGDPARLRLSLATEPGVVLFRQYVDRYRLRYDVQAHRDLRLPAYTGPLELPHVTG